MIWFSLSQDPRDFSFRTAYERTDPDYVEKSENRFIIEMLTVSKFWQDFAITGYDKHDQQRLRKKLTKLQKNEH
jgi:hypothetical protein